MIKEWIAINRKKLILGIIFMIAVISRSALLGVYPVGLHADEAYAGYEAFSLLEYGYDSWGYKNPVYLTAWGSGMNAMESYLMIPFIAIGGLSKITIRIPQFLLGIISVVIFYLLLRRLSNENMALLGSFIMAVCPWHIMLSRWGLESNLMPAFVLLGVYFWIRGTEKEGFFVISAVFWGLSLYCYALYWIFVPFFLIFLFCYCYRYKKIRINAVTVFSVVLLGIIALPLVLFVAVNKGLCGEIVTPYFSIPKMPTFRADEFSLSSIFSNIKDVLRIYIKQYDYNLMNAIPGFGLYYLFSAPFIAIGVCGYIKRTIENIKNKKFGYEIIIVCWSVICLAVAVLRSMSIYRLNAMNLCVLIYLVEGIGIVCRKLKKKWIHKGILAAYVISFLAFEVYYFGPYQKDIIDIQLAGADNAIEYAMEQREQKDGALIRITNRLRHPQVLFYTKYPTDDFISEVKWKNYTDKCMNAESFGCFLWNIEEYTDDIYIICRDEIDTFKEKGYAIKEFEACAVAVLD